MRWIVVRFVAAAFLLLLAAVTGAGPLYGQTPDAFAGPATLPLPPPPNDLPGDYIRLPPVASNEDELFQLETEAARIIALDEALHGTNDCLPKTTLSLTALMPGGASGFGTTDVDLNRTWFWQPGNTEEPVAITPGFGLHLWSGPASLDLPPRVYDLYLDLMWRFCSRECWGIAAGITPGFYGDFTRFDGNAFQLTGWVLGDWTLTEQWSLVGGLAYVRQLESHWLPIGGATWRPNDDLRLDLIFPRPRVAWRWFETPQHDAWLYVAGIFGGGAWSVDGGAGSSVLVQYSDLRLSFGAEFTREAGRVTTVEVGYAFSRDISVESTSLASPSGALFVQAVCSF